MVATGYIVPVPLWSGFYGAWTEGRITVGLSSTVGGLVFLSPSFRATATGGRRDPHKCVITRKIIYKDYNYRTTSSWLPSPHDRPTWMDIKMTEAAAAVRMRTVRMRAWNSDLVFDTTIDYLDSTA